MSEFIVYCLREVGATEPRYIGQTIHSPRHRLLAHISEARSSGGAASPFGRWLNGSVDRIEAIEIARCETREDAKALERHAIIACAGLGFRLFNRDHCPRPVKLRQADFLARSGLSPTERTGRAA